MSTQVKKVYIAGPMSGVPRFNIPLFEHAAKQLRAAGYEVVSPVEHDSPELQAIQSASLDGSLDSIGGSFNGETWGEILARDVKLVADTVDGVAVLPNWNKSRGARLEVFVALLCRKPVYALVMIKLAGGDDGTVDSLDLPAQLIPLNATDVIFAIARSFVS